MPGYLGGYGGMKPGGYTYGTPSGGGGGPDGGASIAPQQSGAWQPWGTTTQPIAINDQGNPGAIEGQGGYNGQNGVSYNGWAGNPSNQSGELTSQEQEQYLLQQAGQGNTNIGNNGLAGGFGLANNFMAQQAPGVNAQWNGAGQGYFANGAGYYGQQGANQAQALGGIQGQQQAYLNQAAQMGGNNSAAMAQLQQGTNAANASAMSTARSQGGNAAQQAAALRNAQNVQAQNVGNAGAQSAQLQAQQQQAAMGLQGGMLNSMAGQNLQQQQLAAQQQQGYLTGGLQAGGQDLNAQISNNQINSANFNAGQALNQNTATSNQQANMATASGIMSTVAGMAGGAAMSDVAAKEDIAPASPPSMSDSELEGGSSFASALGHEMPQQSLSTSDGWGAKPSGSSGGGGAGGMSSMMSMMGGGGSGGGASSMGESLGGEAGAAAMSDERVKDDVRTAANAGKLGEGTKARTSAADQFLATLKPYTFRYKDLQDEPSEDPHGGRYLGIMAQNVEQGPTGDTIVTDTPRGKAIEEKPGLAAALAGIGRLHERLSALEQKERS